MVRVRLVNLEPKLYQARPLLHSILIEPLFPEAQVFTNSFTEAITKFTSVLNSGGIWEAISVSELEKKLSNLHT